MSDCEPFSYEWERKLMRMTKSDLMNYIRNVLWGRRAATIEKSSAVVNTAKIAIGNAAKMREALETIGALAGQMLDGADETTEDYRLANNIETVAMSALAAPPRNCDLPTVISDTHRAWLDDKDNWDEFGDPRLEIHEWLISPAKKGDDNGDK